MICYTEPGLTEALYILHIQICNNMQKCNPVYSDTNTHDNTLHLPGVTEECSENINQDSLRPCRDLNRVPPEYKSIGIPLH
jgi:hypothetical protein